MYVFILLYLAVTFTKMFFDVQNKAKFDEYYKEIC